CGERFRVVRGHGFSVRLIEYAFYSGGGPAPIRRSRGLRIHRCIGYVLVSNAGGGWTTPGQDGRHTRRRVGTRTNLLAAAIAVFASTGLRRVSIAEICEAARYSSRACYSHFVSLDELLCALSRERADLLAEQVAGALAQGGPDLDVPAAVDRVTGVLLLD